MKHNALSKNQINNLQNTQADDKEWFDYYVMDNKGHFIHTVTKTDFVPAALNNKHLKDAPSDQNGKVIKPSSFIIGKVPTVDALAYHPSRDVIFMDSGEEERQYLNTYRPVNYPEVTDYSEAEKVIMKHLHHLLGETKDAELLLDWMAHQVQNIGKLNRFAPLILGTYGDGKSTLGKIMRAAIGKSNVTQVSNSSISSTFTGWANNGAVGVIEELKVNGLAKYETINRLKTFVTDNVVEIIRKGKDSVTVDNVTNYIAFTNFADAVPIDDGDRRWWIMRTMFYGNEFPKSEYIDYWEKLNSFIKDHAPEIRAFLLAHNISDEFKKLAVAPDTTAKELMKEDSLSSGALAYKERIEQYGGRVVRGKYLLTSLITRLESTEGFNHGFEHDLPKGKAVANSLKEIGYKHSVRVSINGQQQRCYSL